MSFKQLILKRYSVRQYKNISIDREQIEKVLDAGRMAPSAVNFQPWVFIVVREPGMLNQIHGCYSREWFKTAPAVIVVCGDHAEGWHRASDGKDHTDIDVAIAVDHMSLQAAELGLGTCWVCNFNPQQAKLVLNLPSNLEPIVMLPIGIPEDNDEISTQKKGRKTLSQIVYWEKYQ